MVHESARQVRPASAAGRKRRRASQDGKGWIFVGPFLAVFALTFLAPIGYAIYLSLYRNQAFFGGKVFAQSPHPETILYSYLTVPRFTVPRWYLEGSASFMETWMAGGLGRAKTAAPQVEQAGFSGRVPRHGGASLRGGAGLGLLAAGYLCRGLKSVRRVPPVSAPCARACRSVCCRCRAAAGRCAA
jgi:hypothetical protein